MRVGLEIRPSSARRWKRELRHFPLTFKLALIRSASELSGSSSSAMPLWSSRLYAAWTDPRKRSASDIDADWAASPARCDVYGPTEMLRLPHAVAEQVL